MLEIRVACAANHTRAMNSAAVRSAALQSVHRKEIEPLSGAVVYYWRNDGKLKPKRFAGFSRWLGPARVIGRDVNGYWLIHRGFPVLVNAKQLRYANEKGVLAWRWTHKQGLADGPAQRGYEDARGPGPPDEERQQEPQDGAQGENLFEPPSTGGGGGAGPAPAAPGEPAAPMEEPAPAAAEAPEDELDGLFGPPDGQEEVEQQAPEEEAGLEQPAPAAGDATIVDVPGTEDDHDLDERQPEEAQAAAGEVSVSGSPVVPVVAPTDEPVVAPPAADPLPVAEGVPPPAEDVPPSTTYGPTAPRRPMRNKQQTYWQQAEKKFATGTSRPSAARRHRNLRDDPSRAEKMFNFFFERVEDGTSTVHGFTARKAARREIHKKDIPLDQRKAFEEGFSKEWNSWMKMGAGTIVWPEEAKKVPKSKIIGSRPVYTDKSAPLRTTKRPLPFKAKCRVVIRGDQEQGEEFLRRDSPTGSHLGSHTLCQTSASRRWPLRALDAENAYFQGEDLDRGGVRTTSSGGGTPARYIDSC